MTNLTTTPTPCWTSLREHAPEVLDDLVDLWARLDTLDSPATGDPSRQIRELRWLIEHLAALVEDLLASHADSDPYDYDDEDWGGDDETDWDGDDEIGLVTL